MAEEKSLAEKRTNLFYQASNGNWTLQKVFEELYKQDKQHINKVFKKVKDLCGTSYNRSLTEIFKEELGELVE